MSSTSFRLRWRRARRWWRPRWQAWQTFLTYAWGTPAAGYVALLGLGVLLETIWHYPDRQLQPFLLLLVAYTLVWPTGHTILSLLSNLARTPHPWIGYVQSIVTHTQVVCWSRRVVWGSAVVLACLLIPVLWQREWIFILCALLPWQWGQVTARACVRIFEPQWYETKEVTV